MLETSKFFEIYFNQKICIFYIKMKIVFYVTDHGLGHASRAIALIKEFKKKNIVVVVRSNDPLGFL